MIPPLAALAVGALLSKELPAQRLASLCFLGAAAALVLGPLLGTGSRPLGRSLSAAAGYLFLALPAALLLGGPPGGAVAAGAALAGFLLLLAGTASVLSRITGRAAAGVGIAAALGLLCVASFHLGDPLLEWDHGRHSRFVLAALHVLNPLSGAVGDALSLDWLRLPIMYSGFPGSLRGALSAAQYYEYSYTPWFVTALLHGGVGAGLLWWGGRFRVPVAAGDS